MTNRDLIKLLLDQPLDAQVYVGKGTGPVEAVEPAVAGTICIVLSPVKGYLT